MIRTVFHGVAGATASLLLLVVTTSEVAGQTVMLPTFSNFSYRGAVMVPDGGSITAGGIKSHSEGATSRGAPLIGNIPGVNRAFRNQGYGRDTGNSSITFNPQILIMSELEEDHLAAAGLGPDGQRDAANAAVLAKARFLTEHMGRHRPDDGPPILPR